MKIQFKEQKFQLDAVSSIVEIFQGQPKFSGVHYMLDPGRVSDDSFDLILDAFKNAPIKIPKDQIKSRINETQTKLGIKPSEKLSITNIKGEPSYNFSIEMETGTGKTYTYIRTIMELNRKYGWLKFIIVVPSVAIREGVLKSFQMTSDHFLMEYETKPNFFVYESSDLGSIQTFANSTNIQVMIINSQAFNATGKDARRIHMEQEDFKWRKPIDVIASTRPILIIDEPQSVEGKKTKESLLAFQPLFTLRYSATHKEKYDMVYRLDALDAYNKKLVKKISVKSIEKSGTTGTDGYLYLQELVPQKTGGPKARIEFEVLTKSGVKRKTQLVSEPFNLYAESGELEAYLEGWTLSHFDARFDTVQIGANRQISVGEVIGEVNEDELRRIQIRETIKSHLSKEEILFERGIKVLSLFFIDEVAKYKQYDSDNNPLNGDYAKIFEEEYNNLVQDYIVSHLDSPYKEYLINHQEPSEQHAGYFSIDKVKKSNKHIFIDYRTKTEQRKQQSNDQDAYDLIMRDKERLLSLEEPTRFIFSHSALKEGWDNPNVFQICTLKQSSAETRKRQEIGRGMRLAVDQQGVRQDEELLGNDVHEINKLTVIANESYDEFTRNLQKELKEILSERPEKVTLDLFKGKVLKNEDGSTLRITEEIASKINYNLIIEGYINEEGYLTDKYFSDLENNDIKLSDSVSEFELQVLEIIDSVYNFKKYEIENENDTEVRLAEHINKENMAKKEFINLWNKINHKSSYQVSFDDNELVDKAVNSINRKLVIKQINFNVSESTAQRMSKEGLEFKLEENSKTTEYLQSRSINTRYDLLGEVAELTGLTRKVVASILSKIRKEKFDMFKQNPEDFILNVGKLINEEKATQIVKHIEYNILEEQYDTSMFYSNTETGKLSDTDRVSSATKSIYDYVKVDSKTEALFKNELEAHEDVKVYVKLPGNFTIPTPLGNYNPDWAIAFREGAVKHIYFVAETKGSMSTLQLKGIEDAKIKCARAHFKALKEKGILDDENIYDVVSSYEELLDIVK